MLGFDKPLYLMAFDHRDAYRNGEATAAASSSAAIDGASR
jgi:hypothetical protein